MPCVGFKITQLHQSILIDKNSKNKTNLTIKKFERLLPNLFVYASDETDDLTPLIEFIKDI